MEEKSIKVIVQNRKARHDYEILETYETGIALVGTEVKSIRAGKVQMKDSYATIEDGELLFCAHPMLFPVVGYHFDVRNCESCDYFRGRLKADAAPRS